MTAPDSSLVLSTVAVLEPSGGSLRARWCYDIDDPYAITLLLRACRDGRERWEPWMFGRELLAAGLLAATGDGDIRLEPYPGDGLLVTLDSPSGRALLRLDARHAARALAGSYRMVPPGREDVDWDLGLELLAAEEAEHGGGGCDCGGGAW